jgi:hypothetical protein
MLSDHQHYLDAPIQFSLTPTIDETGNVLVAYLVRPDQEIELGTVQGVAAGETVTVTADVEALGARKGGWIVRWARRADGDEDTLHQSRILLVEPARAHG